MLKSKRNRLFVLCISALGGMVLASSDSALANMVSLENTDCVKCHDNAPKAIEAQGGKHKTEVTCMDCHDGHPPKVKEIIPACSKCHEGEAHFELEGCLSCHANPHTPLAFSLADNLTAPCLTCHTEQKEKLDANVSAHTELACSMCHAETHPNVPECLNCHESHSENITQADCNRCHEAHKPLAVAYAQDVPSIQCAACHDSAYSLLQSSPAKHHDVACATCHQDKHKMVPNCEDCHGKPHPDGILQRFPSCGDCHSIAHDLNNWSQTGKPKK